MSYLIALWMRARVHSEMTPAHAISAVITDKVSWWTGRPSHTQRQCSQLCSHSLVQLWSGLGRGVVYSAVVCGVFSVCRV